jgi:hypothetical protein
MYQKKTISSSSFVVQQEKMEEERIKSRFFLIQTYFYI